MNLILTMAGKYTRFTNEGYKIPKYLFPWGKHNILSEIINNLQGFDNVFLVANENDKLFFSHVLHIMKNFKIPEENLVIVGDTRSQSDTAKTFLLKRYDTLSGPIVFHNIDTILFNRNVNDIKSKLANNDGYIDIFRSNNHSYSYVLVDDLQKTVYEIQEKILISNIATSGLYGFSNSNVFLDNCDEYDYISSVYKNMILNNQKIAVSTLYDEKNTWVVGTPSEYFNLSNKFLT